MESILAKFGSALRLQDSEDEGCIYSLSSMARVFIECCRRAGPVPPKVLTDNKLEQVVYAT